MTQIQLTENTLKEWAWLTNENQHTEVRIAIARHFDLHYGAQERLKFADAWQEYAENRDALNCGSPTIESILTWTMLDQIRAKYGEDIYKKVCDCL